MLLAEHLDEEVRAAVDHLRLLAEIRHGIHHAEELHDTPNAIEVAEFLLQHRKQVPDRRGERAPPPPRS